METERRRVVLFTYRYRVKQTSLTCEARFECIHISSSVYGEEGLTHMCAGGTERVALSVMVPRCGS